MQLPRPAGHDHLPTRAIRLSRSCSPPVPADLIVPRIEAWFESNQRPLPWRRSYHPYHVWISEVMLQQTRMEVVLPYFDRVIKQFPDVSTLASSPIEKVLAAWSGLGYYRRARMLHAAAVVLRDRFDGNLPRQTTLLQSIPGIGRYTAGAVASIAFDLREAVVEGNVRRVLARVANLDEPMGSNALETRTWQIARELMQVARSPRMLNQGLMELGSLVCRPLLPRCEICPVAEVCKARLLSRVEIVPRPAEKVATRTMNIPLYVVTDERGRILLRRENGPLMTGMLQLLHGNNLLFPQHPSAAGVREISLLGRVSHTVTNRRLQFEVWTASLPDSVAEGPDEFLWVDPQELPAHPHPSYVRKAIALYVEWDERERATALAESTAG